MPIIGLDFEPHGFKAIEIEKRRKENLVLRYGDYDIQKSGDISDDEYAQYLKSFFSEIGFSTPNVVLGLDSRNVFLRVIEIPYMSDRDLGNSIKFEAEQYIPLPLDQVELSYQRLDTGNNKDKKNTGDKINVQIVAAQKKHLERYISILQKANLTPKAIEPEALAVKRSLIDDTINGTTKEIEDTIILDIGKAGSMISVISGGEVRFTRATLIAGDMITKALKEKINLTDQEAEEYKMAYGMEEQHFDGKMFNTIKPIMDLLLSEIKRAIIFFTNSERDANIKRVIITGGTALLPGVLVYLANNLEFEVQLGNPLRNISFSEKKPFMKKLDANKANLYSVAIGLALKEI